MNNRISNDRRPSRPVNDAIFFDWETETQRSSAFASLDHVSRPHMPWGRIARIVVIGGLAAFLVQTMIRFANA